MDEQTDDKEIPQKKHYRKWPWVLLAVIIVVPLLFLGWTGIYHIPVLTAMFGSDKPNDLGVKISDEAFASAMADNPMTLEGDPSEYCGACTKTFSGTVQYDDVSTSEEVTSFITRYTQKAPYIQDIHVKFIDGGMELSGFVVPYVKAPAYARVKVTKASTTSVNIELEQAKIGRLTVPERYYDQIETTAEDIAAQMMAEVPGFSIDELEYRTDGAHFKGTLPKTITPGSTERPLEDYL